MMSILRDIVSISVCLYIQPLIFKMKDSEIY